MFTFTRISILSAMVFSACLQVTVCGGEQAGNRASSLSVAQLGVALSFSTANSDVVSLTVANPVPTGTSTANLNVVVTIGPLSQSFTLDSTGTIGSSGSDAFAITNGQVIVGLQGSFAASFASLGFQNANISSLPTDIPVTIQFGSILTAQATVSGTYVATTGVSGVFISSGTGGQTGGGTPVVFTSFAATPNPADVGAPVKFTVTFSGKPGNNSKASLDFGDGSTPLPLTDANLTSPTSGSASYTYTAAGAFQATLTITTPNGDFSTSTFVVIGQNTAVNAVNGLASTATVANSAVTLSINVSRLPAAVNASTVFSDTLGRDAATPGLLFGRSYTNPTISVATTTALDASSAPVGMVRKMFAVSDRDVNNPSALPLPPSASIKKVKMSGKFLFSPLKPDQVSFSGAVQLPAGFNPSAAGGNLFVVGMGNVVGSVSIGAKGKPAAPPSGGPIKSVSVKYPKVAGQALGGETATLTVTFASPNLSQAGFDTEGITQALRPDEKGLKAANRFIQTSFLLGGVKYEGYIPVVYKLAKNGASGTMGGRSGL